VADVLVVNKADRDGAAETVRQLRHMITLGGATAWRRPVVRTVASRRDGIEDLVAALDAHREWIDASGERERRRIARASGEIEAIALERVRARFGNPCGGIGLADLAKRVVAGEIDPYRAAEELTG
jgi:LAO/AO transport system kinase